MTRCFQHTHLVGSQAVSMWFRSTIICIAVMCMIFSHASSLNPDFCVGWMLCRTRLAATLELLAWCSYHQAFGMATIQALTVRTHVAGTLLGPA